jgi:hypothetical protein
MKAGVETMSCLPRSPPVANRSGRAGTGVLFTPFRTWTTHVVQLWPIRIENRLLQSVPNLDHRHQVGRCESDVSGWLGRAENRNCCTAHGSYLI